jgi:tetratricopeptide (TPR) repeat protein
MAATPAAMKPQAGQVAGVCIVLVLAVLAVFGQTAAFEFVNYDDNGYVYENTHVAGGLSLKGLAWVFTHADCHLYHPLTMLSLMGDYQLYGLYAGGYHLTNVVLHAASAILLFLILRQMTGALWRSAFVAAVFAIHPLRVESVAWVAERKDVLSAFFFMLTLGAYARYVRKPDSPARYLMVAAAFLLALLSKPTVVTLPFVLLLLDYWPLRRFEPPRKLSGLILEKIPLLALAAGACVMTVLAEGTAIVSNESIPMPLRIGNALVSLAVYLRQMVWPAELAPFYPLPAKGYPVWTMALSFLLLALMTGGVLAFQRKRRWLLAGWLWYLGMLTPMIGIVQVGGFAHADRFTYLPQIGIYLAVTWLAAEWRLSRVVLGGLMTGVLAVLMVCAWKQMAYWQNSETLWTHTLACTIDNATAHKNLGYALLQKGQPDEAITHFLKALEIQPDNGEAHFNLGNILRLNGRTDEAITQYQEAVRLKPSIGQAHNNLGTALRQKGRLDEAIAQYQMALQIEPDNDSFHFNLAKAFCQKGKLGEAIIQYQMVLQINPADVEVQNNLAWLLATCPQASLRNGDKAVQLARQANELFGGKHPVVLRTLAAACAEAGRFSEAVEIAQRALHLAEAQSDTRLAGQLQLEMKLYQSDNPYHSPEQTH